MQQGGRGVGWGGVGGKEFWFSSKYYEMQSTNCFFLFFPSFLLSFLKGVINGPHGAPYLHQDFWPHRFGYGETIIILHPPSYHLLVLKEPNRETVRMMENMTGHKKERKRRKRKKKKKRRLRTLPSTGSAGGKLANDSARDRRGGG